MATDQPNPFTSGDGGSAPQGRPDERSEVRVAVFNVPDEREGLYPILEVGLRLDRIDARVQARRLPGLLPEPIPANQATWMIRELQQLGVQAVAVPGADVPDLRHAHTLHHVRCQPDGMVVVGMSGEAGLTVPWGELALMSIGDVPRPLGRPATVEPDGVFHHRPGIAETESETQGHIVELWLVDETGKRAFRIDHESMNYEYLGAGRSTSAFANFNELVRDIRNYAPALFLTRSARAFLTPTSVEDYRFPSSDAHREFVQWQILLMQHARQAAR